MGLSEVSLLSSDLWPVTCVVVWVCELCPVTVTCCVVCTVSSDLCCAYCVHGSALCVLSRDLVAFSASSYARVPNPQHKSLDTARTPPQYPITSHWVQCPLTHRRTGSSLGSVEKAAGTALTTCQWLA
eukprot:3574812-Rhodomonas_salina.1